MNDERMFMEAQALEIKLVTEIRDQPVGVIFQALAMTVANFAQHCKADPNTVINGIHGLAAEFLKQKHEKPKVVN